MHIVSFMFRLAASAKDEARWGRSVHTPSRPRDMDDIDINDDTNINVDPNGAIDPPIQILVRVPS